MRHLKVWTNENAKLEYFLGASLNVMVVMIFENNGSNYKKGVFSTGKSVLGFQRSILRVRGIINNSFFFAG